MLLGAGLLALAFAGVALIATAMSWWRGYNEQTRWPRAEATIRECKVVAHKASRNSQMFLNNAECSIEFVAADGKRVEGGMTSRPFADTAPLERWVAQHPPGARLAVHYDPAWPPSAVPAGPLELFDANDYRLFLKAAEIAGGTAAVLLALALLLRRR